MKLSEVSSTLSTGSPFNRGKKVAIIDLLIEINIRKSSYNYFQQKCCADEGCAACCKLRLKLSSTHRPPVWKLQLSLLLVSIYCRRRQKPVSPTECYFSLVT